jgi:hypothetical protein
MLLKSVTLAVLLVTLNGCAAPKHVMSTQLQRPETMSPIDGSIAITECRKQGLLARKAYIEKYPAAEKIGFNSPVFLAQQKAEDACLTARGIAIKSRVVR